MLSKVISGGQTGVDQAGIIAAAKCGIETGGWAPRNYKTNAGTSGWLKRYNLAAHFSSRYELRTGINVNQSDGTIRIAGDFSTPGEICTMRFIREYGKPYIDVDIGSLLPVQDVVQWIIDNKISVLNVAGNSEESCPGIYDKAYVYLVQVFGHFAESGIA